MVLLVVEYNILRDMNVLFYCVNTFCDATPLPFKRQVYFNTEAINGLCFFRVTSIFITFNLYEILLAVYLCMHEILLAVYFCR